MSFETNAATDSRRSAVTDIVIVILASGAAFVVELALSDFLPWGEEGRGVIAVFVGAAAALAVTVGRGDAWAELGFKRPARWWTVPFWAIGILVAYIAAQAIAPLLVAPFFEIPEPDLSRYDYVRGNLTAAITLALLLPFTAAIPEEIIYRGFLMNRLSRFFGTGHRGTILTVLVQALLFGSVHYQWGVGGVIVTIIMGVVWGTAFMLCSRNLWIVIIAHSTAHVALVLQLYLSPAPA